MNVSGSFRIRLLFANGEPFRVLFPAGFAAAFAGAMLWPLHDAGALSFYPGLAHARIMIFGFFGAFVMGFLGTAGPRMLAARALRGWEVALLAAGWAVSLALYLTGRWIPGDWAVVATGFVGAAMAVPRVIGRSDLPPPNFVLVVFGLVAGWGGLLLQLGAAHGLALGNLPLSAVGKDWIQEGFLILAILGVAPFFFPRFFGERPGPEIWKTGAAWRRTALLCAGVGALYLVLLTLESIFPANRLWRLARVALVLAYACRALPFPLRPRAVGTLGRVVQIALLLALAGLALPLALPRYEVGWFHLLSGGGYGLITLCVGSWVCFAHGGAIERGTRHLPALWTAAGLLLLALATRAFAELMPAFRDSHLVYAGVAWALGVAIWAAKVVPLVLVEEY